jgi:hypothetical protein
MKIKTAFTTAAILLTYTTCFAIEKVPDTALLLSHNLPIVAGHDHNATLYCKIDSRIDIEALAMYGKQFEKEYEKIFKVFRKNNQDKGFEILQIDDHNSVNGGKRYFWITHENPVFLINHALGYNSIEQQKNQEVCRIFSEDISDFKSTCVLHGDNSTHQSSKAALKYAIDIYADSQQRPKSNSNNVETKYSLV